MIISCRLSIADLSRSGWGIVVGTLVGHLYFTHFCSFDFFIIHCSLILVLPYGLQVMIKLYSAA